MDKKALKADELSNVNGGVSLCGEKKCQECGKVLPVGTTGCVNLGTGEWLCWDCRENCWWYQKDFFMPTKIKP